ncbi:MAG: cell division protein FtsZ [Ruminococcaceae bacterium]|nr:cell division protein FtsZ [Oscillospiraceae bacterium]
MTFEHDDSLECGVNIKVIGVGGGGNNAVNRMIVSNIRGVDFVSVNTDRQALRKSEAPSQLVIGEKITRGFGAGANPQIGERAAEESIDDIRTLLEGTDMVFITAGMGGGTGTGAAPVVARVARELDILTVGIVTKPFNFEGKRRMEQAEAGIAELAQYVDSLIVIPNERLKEVTATKISISNAFNIADDVLRRGVKSISDLINVTGLINLDFADVTSVMANAGYAHMGVGAATGKDKAEQAAREAISSPLLETSIKGAKGILMNISVSPDVALEDTELASTLIAQEAHEDANVIWGVTLDEELEDEMRITIIATGFEKKPEDAARNVPKNRTSVFQKEAAKAAAPAEAPVEKKAAPAEAPAVRRVVKPVPKQTKPVSDDDDFDDILDIVRKKK